MQINKILNHIALFTLLIAFSCSGQGSKNNDQTKIVAKYKNGEVSSSEMQLELDKISAQNEKLKDLSLEKLNDEQKELLAKEVALKKLALIEAKRRGLHNDKDYQKALMAFESELLSQKLYIDIAKKASEEENVKKHYDKLAKDIEGKKEVKLSFIALKKQSEANLLNRTLKANPASFASQAKRKSIDKDSAKNGGDLGFVLKDQLQPEILNELKNLKDGDVSSPIFIADKWIIIRYLGERDAVLAKYDDTTKSVLKNKLSTEAIQEYTKTTLKNADLKMLK